MNGLDKKQHVYLDEGHGADVGVEEPIGSG